MRFAGFLFVALFGYLQAGCGLSDYEAQIDKQRARLRVIDEENKYLGEMLEPPPLPWKDAPRPIPFDIFLRLPRGIAPTVAEDGKFYLNDQLTNNQHLYRYKSTEAGTEGFSVFLAAARRGQGDPQKADLSPEEFFDQFRLAVCRILNKSWRPPAKIERLVESIPAVTKEKQPGLVFDFFELEDESSVANGSQVSFYFHQQLSRYLALAYQVPLGKKADFAVQRGVYLSARSLDIGESAAGKRKAYGESRRVD